MIFYVELLIHVFQLEKKVHKALAFSCNQFLFYIFIKNKFLFQLSDFLFTRSLIWHFKGTLFFWTNVEILPFFFI